MSEWPSTKLEDLAAPSKNALATGPFGSSIGSRFFRDQGVPVIRGSNLSLKVGERLIDEGIVFVDEQKADEFPRSVAQRGDLVFTCWGTIGQVGLIDENSRFDRYIVSNKQMKLTPDSGRVDSLFLYYALSSPHMMEQVQGMSIGSSVPGFNLTQLRQLEVPFPLLAVQKAVASLLGALDDKIAVNERIATTADELMRAIYREADGNSAESITIGELGRLIRDGVSASSLNGGEHYIGLEHMPRRNVWLSGWEENAELASGKFAFRSNDVLFGKLRPYFHKVGLALTSGICSTDILVVRPTESDRLGWLLLALSSDEVVAHASAVGDGTRMPRAKWKDLESFVVPWPGNAEAARLDQVVRSMAARVQASVQESRTLAVLRDTLLPQLMSGRLRVKDAEKIVEDHA
ncbi:restriction endonuclease subunit S [Streptomyces sp. ISL-36]|uniref:restriction endonuclease subunit S n=1 Tax=Streptomyces sp. ISL-36 TaxID=2819182 RepID=UPI001BEA777A|nr:restriction endonuclease subunit S [Streptomyces sp. ISL-36]MBT2441016.1 restriction endonuclease subunit S [Streptomyces sp. ISL-36]